MIEKPELQIHYGTWVYTNVKMDKLRKTECLCLNCSALDECLTAKELYTVCVSNNLSLAITQCPNWSKKP